MNTINEVKICDHVSKVFAERWRCHDRSVLRQTLLSMVEGRSTNALSISKRSSIPQSNVVAALTTDRYDVSDSGEVVEVFGVGTEGRCPFELVSRGSTLNICCALVSLIVSQLSPDQKTILSVDPVSNRRIEVISESSFLKTDPIDAVAVLVAPTVDEFCNDPWNSFCKYVRLYESTENASAGSIDAPSAVYLSVDDLYRIAQSLSREFWG
jgi:hypothetical protein